MAYTKQNFVPGQTLTAAQLNYIETGIKTLESKDTELQTLITDSTTDNFRFCYSSSKPRQYIYVACNTGKDTNSGTKSSPVKTLAKVAELCNKGMCDIRTAFTESGTYIVPAGEVCNVVWHAQFQADNITLLFDNPTVNNAPSTACIYNSHLSWHTTFSNVKIGTVSGEPLQFENCVNGFENFNFVCNLVTYGGLTEIVRGSLQSVLCTGGDLLLDNTSLRAVSKSYCVYANWGCRVETNGVINIEDTTVSGANMFTMQRGSALTMGSEPVVGTGYTQSVDLTNATLHAPVIVVRKLRSGAPIALHAASAVIGDNKFLDPATA